jgi:hypothetical protein
MSLLFNMSTKKTVENPFRKLEIIRLAELSWFKRSNKRISTQISSLSLRLSISYNKSIIVLSSFFISNFLPALFVTKSSLICIRLLSCVNSLILSRRITLIFSKHPLTSLLSLLMYSVVLTKFSSWNERDFAKQLVKYKVT